MGGWGRRGGGGGGGGADSADQKSGEGELELWEGGGDSARQSSAIQQADMLQACMFRLHPSQSLIRGSYVTAI